MSRHQDDGPEASPCREIYPKSFPSSRGAGAPFDERRLHGLDVVEDFATPSLPPHRPASAASA